MSVHYTNPVIFEECHATYILNDAHIDVPNLEIVDKLPENANLHIRASVSYNSHIEKIPFFGETNTCTCADVDYYYAEDIGFFYPLYEVEDYGDEGSFETSAYLYSPEDLFYANMDKFDEIKIEEVC